MRLGTLRITIGGAAFGAAALIGAIHPESVASPRDGEGGVATVGPDVIVGALTGMSSYGTISGISAYAIGTTSCNIGDALIWWIDSGSQANRHPVIAQNLFRIRDGRIEQIGQSWLKHGFCALAGTLCGTCTSHSYGCDALGIGCSDPYSSGLNGSQSGLGPRSQVNPVTGYFPYPFTAPAAPATVGRRLQVAMADLVPADNVGALYFGEGLYISPDDAAAGNSDNNASYRQVTVGAISSGAYSLSMAGPTVQQKAAIWAWREHGNGLNVPDPTVSIVNVDVPGDGRFIVASKARSVSAGEWRYDYAIYNLDSDRAAQSVSVPTTSASSLYFRGVPSHSGEPYQVTPWDMSFSGGRVTWSTLAHAQNANANALRWGTMYTFSFRSTRAPGTGELTIGLFKPGATGAPSQVTATVTAPAPSPAGDLNGDGYVNAVDLSELLACWDMPCGDLDGNDTTNGLDLTALLSGWTG